MTWSKKSETEENVKGYEGTSFYTTAYIYDNDYNKQF